MKSSASLRVCIAGASGRVGRQLVEATTATDDFSISGALVSPTSPYAGASLDALVPGAGETRITSIVDDALEGADVLIDFTRAHVALGHVKACRDRRINVVMGTTGFDRDQLNVIAAVAEEVAIVTAANMSIGGSTLIQVAGTIARALCDGFDVDVVGTHHRTKAELPSGTSIALGEALAAASGRDLDSCAFYGHGADLSPRTAGSIGFSSIRGGDTVGEHAVIFSGNGERFEIIHRAFHRSIYAQGSLRAARFVAGRRCGLFTMDDVMQMR